MPRGFEPQGGEGGGEFLKVEDGEAAIVILTEEPFQLGVHRVDDGSEYGQKIYCGREDLGRCPICDGDVAVKLRKDRRESTGFYALYVHGLIKRGSKTPEPVEKMMKMEGGWSLINPFQSEWNIQQMTGESLVGVPMILQRSGEKAATRYNLSLKPNLKITPEGDPIDLEEFVLGRIREGWNSLGFTPSHAPDYDPFEGGSHENLSKSTKTTTPKPADSPVTKPAEAEPADDFADLEAQINAAEHGRVSKVAA